MGTISKSLRLLLVVMLAVSSLLAIQQTYAQSIPKPSAPEFTVKYADYSYDVPPTYGIDQYTGKNVTINEGYHVDNRTIVFTIKNQPFTAYSDSSGNHIELYYNFKAKGHYGDDFVLYPFSNEPSRLYPDTNAQSVRRGSDSSYSPKYPASNSEYTEIAIPAIFFNLYGPSIGRECDFGVQAMVGHIDPINSGPISGEGYYSFTGQFSDWSPTQTIYLDTTQPNPTVPELPWLALLPLCLIVLSVALVLKRRKVP